MVKFGAVLERGRGRSRRGGGHLDGRPFTRSQVQDRAHIVPPQRPDTDQEQRHDGGHQQGVVPPRARHESNLPRDVCWCIMPPMNRLFLVAAALVVAPRADAARAKKYHFELTKVLVKEAVKPDAAKTAQPLVEAQIKKKFETHPQLVAALDGA